MQTMMQYGLRCLWIFLELLSLHLVAESFLPDTGGRKRWQSLCALWLGMTVCTCVGLPLPVLAAVGVAGVLVWTALAYPGRWQRRVGTALFSCLLGVAIDGIVCLLVSMIMGVRFSAPEWRRLLSFVALTASKLIHLFAAFLIRRFHMPDAAGFVLGKGLFLSLLFPGMGLLLVVAEYQTFHGSTDSSGSAILTCCVLVIANIAVLYLLRKAEKTEKTGSEMTMLHKQMELQTQSILSLEKSYRAQRKTAHEFRHHLQTRRDLLDSGRVEAAKAYVEQLQNTHSTRVLCVNTHHPIVDAVLNQKYQTAVEHSIDVQMQVNDLSGLKMDPEALVVTLTNLLDNAIEACERLQGERCIRCSVLLEDTLFLSVSNTAPPVEIRDNTIKSTKMPRQDHGFGLPAICSVLEGLKAEYAFDYENGWFRFVAEIPLAKNESTVDN